MTRAVILSTLGAAGNLLALSITLFCIGFACIASDKPQPREKIAHVRSAAR